MTMDYTFEKRLEFQREEAVEEGRKLGEEFGIKLGEKNGMQKVLHDQIRKKLIKNKSLEQIAEEIEESVDTVSPMYVQVKREMSDEKNRLIFFEIVSII